MKIKTILFTFFLTAALLLLPLQSSAAQTSSLSLHLEQADLTAFPQMSVRLSAWDASGLPLAGLAAGDFTLQENGGTPFHPASVQADADAPLSVMLVMDISGSMTGQPLVDAKQAAARFLDRLSSSDRAGLIAFNDTINPDPAQMDPKHELAFSNNLAPLYDLITSLQASGDTHVYDAMAKAVKLTAGLPGGHRAILLLSDGQNQPPTLGDPQEAIKLAQAANLPISVIGLGNEIDEAYLRSLAGGTGGVFLLAPKSSELANLFGNMATLLKTQYVLTYTSKVANSGQDYSLTVTLNTAQGSANTSLRLGTTPLITPTFTPTFTPIPTLTSTPTFIPSVIPTVMPTPTPLVWKDIVVSNWGWLLAAVLALGLALWFTASRMRRPRLKKEACAQCGYDLTGLVGACPQCGGTRRLPKR